MSATKLPAGFLLVCGAMLLVAAGIVIGRHQYPDIGGLLVAGLFAYIRGWQLLAR